MRGKLSDFNSHFSDQEFDIISVAELWLNDSIYDGEILSGLQYNIYRKGRNLKRTSKRDGGGVLCAIHNSLSSIRRENLKSDA